MAYDIHIRGLGKRFGAVQAVNEFDLDVAEGEMVGLIGPDGAGKTTVLRILCGLFSSDSGTARVGGRDVRTERDAVRRFIGYMPQRFSLYPDLTVEENIRFFADLFLVPDAERERRLARLLEFSRLGPFVKRRAAALSGGMKQKLALSCTLIHSPKIFLLDEPTTGVDPLSRREFWEILHELHGEGVTLLVTTPYLDEAAKTQRVAFMSAGRILADTKPEDAASLCRNTIIEFRCGDPIAAARALDAAGIFESVQSLGDRVHAAGKAPAGDLVRRGGTALKSAGIAVQSAREIPPGIEDVFVELLRAS